MDADRSVLVYGVFDGDRCVYVGRTTNAELRKYSHSRRFPSCEFRELFHVTPELADKTERDQIRHYKALGQAEHNIIGGEKIPQKSVYVDEAVWQFAKAAAIYEDSKFGALVTQVLQEALEQRYGSYADLLGLFADRMGISPDETEEDSAA